METFSTLLAFSVGNSPVLPAQRPVTRSFDVFFDLRLNKRLSKQSWGWWFETLSCPLWRHSNEVGNPSTIDYFLASSSLLDNIKYLSIEDPSVHSIHSFMKLSFSAIFSLYLLKENKYRSLEKIRNYKWDSNVANRFKIYSGITKASNKWGNIENNSFISIKIMWSGPYAHLAFEALFVWTATCHHIYCQSVSLHQYCTLWT